MSQPPCAGGAGGASRGGGGGAGQLVTCMSATSTSTSTSSCPFLMPLRIPGKKCHLQLKQTSNATVRLRRLAPRFRFLFLPATFWQLHFFTVHHPTTHRRMDEHPPPRVQHPVPHSAWLVTCVNYNFASRSKACYIKNTDSERDSTSAVETEKTR